MDVFGICEGLKNSGKVLESPCSGFFCKNKIFYVGLALAGKSCFQVFKNLFFHS